QQGRLAAARLADERDELLALDAQVDVTQREGRATARLIPLRDSLEVEVPAAGALGHRDACRRNRRRRLGAGRAQITHDPSPPRAVAAGRLRRRERTNDAPDVRL